MLSVRRFGHGTFGFDDAMRFQQTVTMVQSAVAVAHMMNARVNIAATRKLAAVAIIANASIMLVPDPPGVAGVSSTPMLVPDSPGIAGVSSTRDQFGLDFTTMLKVRTQS